MLARHPKTGKDIRIISLETSISRDQKTLAWFTEPPAELERWDRWDIGTTSAAAAEKLAAAGLPADIVVCLGPHEETAAWCTAGHPKAARIVAVSRSFVEFITIEKLAALRLGNLMCLDEIHDMYPFVGEKWDGTENDAKVLMAIVLQMSRTFPVAPSSRSMRGLRIESELVRPQPLWLVTQYYKPDQSKRRQEIESCLKKNLECSVIDKVVLLNEKACAPKHAKIEEHVIMKRLTYAEVIRWIYEIVPNDTLVAFANADIFLDGDSWRSIWSADLESVPKFVALLRWDVIDASADSIANAKLFGPRADSQDTWLVSANAVKALDWDYDALSFPFGKGGCDNAITMEMLKKRFIVANPALTLKTYHLHTSGIRNYNPRDIVDKPAYLHIHPTGLHDKKPVLTLSNIATPHVFKFESFERRIKGPLTNSQARTFCTMVSRSTQGVVQLDVDEPNIWAPPPVSLYRLNDLFQTRDGLAYTYDSILVGNSKASATAWSGSQISYLAAALTVEDAMVAPLPDAIANSPARFILEYMSKVFLLREEFGSKAGEFWCSKAPGCIEAIKMFSWPNQEIPVISRDENQQSWCNKAAMWPYQDTPEGFISREEVGALRSALGLGGWKEESVEKQLVVVVDTKWFTDDVVEMIEAGLDDTLKVKVVWAGRSSLDTCLRAMRGAWGVLMFDQAFAPWSWVLPKGGYVWEVQNEMEPSASLLHSSCAAELEHRLTIVPKGQPNDAEKKKLVEKLVTGIRAELIPVELAMPKVSKPKIFLPHGHTGFFAHAGDSFREMAALWAERGFVDCVKSSDAHNIWLGSIGGTLLYDRPTHEWLDRAPPAEKKWRTALFGNPAPPSNSGGVSSWSFWPRRPALVEAMVAKGTPSKPWESRAHTLVFYGRSENAVQKKRRSGFDWQSKCSDFVHVDGLNPYPFTQEQYLEKLTDARFGLCLAGYGNKCHREIECMAMGCIPIVAAEVDMENYADPPEEGLHYFRVTSPEGIAPLLEKTTAERWTVMSVACRDWWRRNASVEGMWELTKRLSI